MGACTIKSRPGRKGSHIMQRSTAASIRQAKQQSAMASRWRFAPEASPLVAHTPLRNQRMLLLVAEAPSQASMYKAPSEERGWTRRQ